MSGAFYCHSELTEPGAWSFRLFRATCGSTSSPRAGLSSSCPTATGPRSRRASARWSPAGGPHAAQRSRRPGPRDPGTGSRAGLRALRGPASRWRRGTDAPDVRCGALDHPAAHNLVAVLRRRDPASTPAPGPRPRPCRARCACSRPRRAMPRPGGSRVITRLADILVIQASAPGSRPRPGPQRAGWARCATRRSARRSRLMHGEPGPRLDGRLARPGAGDVALVVRRPIHGARRRAGDAVRDPLAHAGRAHRAA